MLWSLFSLPPSSQWLAPSGTELLDSRLFIANKGRLLYPAKLSFRMEGQIRCFPDKVKLKEFIITKPLLYEMLKGLIQEKEDQNYEQ